MGKRIYISADYAENNGDRDVVAELKRWANSNYYSVDFVDMAEVKSGSVSQSDDCRPCDLKKEFNQQIILSSVVVFVVGDKTKTRLAGGSCNRNGSTQYESFCTPYKQNTNGRKICKVANTYSAAGSPDVGCINSYSYLQHEFEEAKKRNKPIVILYNSMRKEENWLPSYMSGYENCAYPFWIKNAYGSRVGNYQLFKEALGF